LVISLLFQRNLKVIAKNRAISLSKRRKRKISRHSKKPRNTKNTSESDLKIHNQIEKILKMTEEKTEKLEFKADIENIDIDYIFKLLFKGTEFPVIAKKMVVLAAKKDKEGLFEKDYQYLMNEHNLTKYQYFSILRTLKQLGLLKKKGDRYYPDRDFANCLSRMSSRTNEFFDKLGVHRTI